MRLLIPFLLIPLMINAQAQIDTSGPVDTRLIQTVVTNPLLNIGKPFIMCLNTPFKRFNEFSATPD
jgi:hypothetical protein